MLKLKNISLKDFSVYKEVTFKLKKGISVIRGKNASGKSLIGSALPLTFWEHPVSGKKLKDKGSTSVELVKDDITYSVTKFFKPTKYIVLKNKKDMQFTTIKEAEKFTNNVFSISPEYFWNCCYLSSARPNAIQFCSPTERLIHFCKLFNLDVYEFLHDKIKQLLQTKKADKQQHNIYSAQLSTLRSQTVKPNLERLKFLQSKYSKIKDSIEENQKQIAINNQIKSIKDCMELDFTEEKTLDLYDRLKNRIEQMQDNVITYESKKKAYLEYKKSLKYKDALPYNLVSKLCNNFTDSELQEIKKAESWLNRGVIPFELKPYYGKLDSIRVEYIATKSDLEKFMKLDGKGICPTCGSELNIFHCKKEIQRLQDKVLMLEKELKKAEAAEQYYNCKRITWCSSDTYLFLQNWVQEQFELSHEAKHYQNIKKVEKPEKPDVKKLQEYKQKLERLSNHRTLLKQLEGLTYKKVDTSEEQMEKVNSLLTKITELKLQKQNYDKNKAEIEDLESKLCELDIEDLELLEVLLEAYGNKGIKSKQIEVILDTYCLKLNEFATLLYEGKYIFSHKTDGNKCEIFAERNGKVGDISTFSGFETRAFQLINCLALVSMLGIKLDTLWVDEMENGMDENTLYKFTNSFLPQLKRYIPKIVLITPRTQKELCVVGAYEYRVTKKNNHSKIEEV